MNNSYIYYIEHSSWLYISTDLNENDLTLWTGYYNAMEGWGTASKWFKWCSPNKTRDTNLEFIFELWFEYYCGKLLLDFMQCFVLIWPIPVKCCTCFSKPIACNKNPFSVLLLLAIKMHLLSFSFQVLVCLAFPNCPFLLKIVNFSIKLKTLLYFVCTYQSHVAAVFHFTSQLLNYKTKWMRQKKKNEETKKKNRKIRKKKIRGISLNSFISMHLFFLFFFLNMSLNHEDPIYSHTLNVIHFFHNFISIKILFSIKIFN